MPEPYETACEGLYVSLEDFLRRYDRRVPPKALRNLRIALKIIGRLCPREWHAARDVWRKK